MWGSETFEMLVSSNSMNVAIVTVSAIAHSLCLTCAPGAPAGGGGAAIADEIAAAILLAPLTFRDAADAQDPGRGRTRSEPAGVAPPLRSSRLHSRRAGG